MPVNCTFEATPIWGTLLEREFGLKSFQLEGDGFAITLWRHPFYRRCVSSPFRDRMAVSWQGTRPSPRDLIRTLDSAPEAEIVAKDIGWFAAGDGASGIADPHLVVRYANADVLLDADIESRIRRTTAQVLRKAQRGTPPFVTLDKGEGLDDFYRLYLQTRRRLGVLPYSRAFFRYWYDRIGEHTVAFKCADGDTPMGFLLCYLHGDEMMPSLLAYDYQHRKKAITDLLHMHAFLWGRDHGYRNYRFGGDNLEQDTLIESKLKLGAVVRRQRDYLKPVGDHALELSNATMRRILRHTPPALFRHSSRLTRFYFS
jgi:hypothetical protein